MKTVYALVAAIGLVGCASQAAPGPVSHVRQVEGPRTVTTLIEDFDQGMPAVPLLYRADHWGDRIKTAKGRFDIVKNASPEGGAAARFDFQATFDKPYSIESDWKGSGVQFVARIELGNPPPGSEGVALRLKPEGVSRLEMYLVQDSLTGTRTYVAPVLANEGAWKEWKVPFRSFSPTDRGPLFDPGRAVSVEIYATLEENWNAHLFRTGSEAKCALVVDDVGFWKSKGEDAPGVVEGFDDERDRMPFSVVLYGSSMWTDYSTSDQGIPMLNEGVKAERLQMRRIQDGQEDGAFTIEGRLELDPAVHRFHEAGQSMVLYVKAPLGRPLTDFHGLTFYARSDLFQGGQIELLDEENETYYEGEFSVSEEWSRALIPFSSLRAGDITLATAKKVTATPKIQLVFELPPKVVEQAAEKGVLEFSISFDRIALEE